MNIFIKGKEILDSCRNEYIGPSIQEAEYVTKGHFEVVSYSYKLLLEVIDQYAEAGNIHNYQELSSKIEEVTANCQGLLDGLESSENSRLSGKVDF